MSNKLLTPRQMELYALFIDKGDVPIEDLYVSYYTRDPILSGHGSPTRMQQALGWPITTLNSRLRHMEKRIVPGEARRTYRLIDKR